jgi:hypothetical protein
MNGDAAVVPRWWLSGWLVGECNCAWGCPCNFDAPPTYGFCDGMYTLVVREGAYGDARLDGVVFLMGGHSPAAIHEGNGTSLLIMDERMTDDQRAAIETLWRGGGVGMPFDAFAAMTTTWLEPIVAPVEVTLAGIRSRVSVRGGELYEVAASRIPNPVTGEEEEVYLDKPTGFTSCRSELGTALVGRLATPGLRWDHVDTYAEYAEFDYSGPYDRPRTPDARRRITEPTGAPRE